MVAGHYARDNGGADLRRVQSDLLFPIAYVAMRDDSLRTKEETEQLEKLNKRLRDLQFQHDTGLPAIAMMIGPADGSAV
jgi:hypothetical protein